MGLYKSWIRVGFEPAKLHSLASSSFGRKIVIGGHTTRAPKITGYNTFNASHTNPPPPSRSRKETKSTTITVGLTSIGSRVAECRHYR
jgi:hypothetical protein